MYTIKQTAALTGIHEPTLRAWERRYAVVVPARSDGGYRLYDDEAIETLRAMRRLVEAGWAPAQAAETVRHGTVTDTLTDTVAGRSLAPRAVTPASVDALSALEDFLASAAALDTAGIDDSLDRGMSLGSFEHVVDTWLCPALEALGEGWARGEIDVAGEHAASHAVHRRLSAAFEAAGSRSRGPSVVVGLPPGSQHELGALAFATAIRRLGLDVLYLGANVPLASWDAAVTHRCADAAVLSVVTPDDRAPAAGVTRRLLADHSGILVGTGGASAAGAAPGVHELDLSITMAARRLEDLLHHEHARRSDSTASRT